MGFKKSLGKKMMAVLLALILVMGVMPAGLATAFAAQPECLAANVNSKKVYFYGAKTLEVNENNSVSFTTDAAEEEQTAATVYVGGTETGDSQITATTNSVSFGNWLDSQSDWIAVKCVSSAQIPTDEPNVDVDETAPEITGISGNSSEWTNKDVTLTVEAKDNKGGTGVVAYGINEEDGIKWQSEAEFNITANGTYTFYVKDAVGNISEINETSTTKIEYIDKTAPTISVSYNPKTWTNNSVTVTVTATDKESGIPETGAYRLDSEEDWQDGNEFTISDNTEHEIYVKDNAGNIGSTKFTAAYDNVAPTITDIKVTRTTIFGTNEYKKNDYTSPWSYYDFQIIAKDDKSGVAFYSADGKNWDTNATLSLKGGQDKYTFYAKDAAGNVSEVYIFSLKSDTTAPAVTVKQDKTEKTNQAITFTVEAQDSESGLARKPYKFDDGKWTNERSISIENDAVHTVTVRDREDNETTVNFQAANFCKGKPKITGYTLNNENWTNQSVELSLTAEGNTNASETTFDVVEYCMDGKWTKENKFTISDAKDHVFKVKNEAGTESDEITYSVANFDNNAPILDDNEQNKAVTFESKYDTKIYEKLNNVLNFLGFDNFFNKELKITVKAADVADNVSNASGIVFAQFVFKDADNKNKYTYEPKNIGNNEKATIKFEVTDLPDNFKGTASVILTDAAGNTSTIPVTTGNSNLGAEGSGTAEFTLENNPPKFADKTEEVNKGKSSKDRTYANSFTFSAIVSDDTFGEDKTNVSGIAYIEVLANGVPVYEKDFQKAEKAKNNHVISFDVVGAVLANGEINEDVSYTVNGVNLKNWSNPKTGEAEDRWGDGKIEFVINAYDNSGNFAKSDVMTYNIDQTSPVISNFKFNQTEPTKENSGCSVEYNNGDYQFYFKNDTKVTITAEDKTNPEHYEVTASGVASITAYLEDVDGTKYIIPSNDAEIVKATEKMEPVAIETDKDISFTIPANFKGQIYAFATDAAGNSPTNAVYFEDFDNNPDISKADKNGFVHPNGTIVENEAKHDESSNVQLDLKEESNVKDENGNPLYGANTEVAVTVEDTYSGINQIEWSIKSDTNTNGENSNQSGQVAVTKTDEGKISVSDNTWNIDSTDENLVTKLSSTLTVSKNSNNIKITVKLTDNAGNTTEEHKVISVDKTAPKIVVHMNENDDENFAGFFKGERTADIYVYERNFDVNDYTINVQKTDDNGNTSNVSPKLNFKKIGSQQINGIESYVYKATTVFSDDGDYTFGISAQDKAAHINNAAASDHKASNSDVLYSSSKSESFNEQNDADRSIDTSFTIDNTAPVVSVSYDNNEAQNDKYFKAGRTATITVNEHNFTTENNRITYTRTSTKDGAVIEEPSVSAWSRSGNTYTATINYSADGDYTFDMQVVDKAGNKCGNVNYTGTAAKDFTVDKTTPTLIISGVENGKAYTYDDSVIPKIEFSDINFAGPPEITLMRAVIGQNQDVKNEIIGDVAFDSHGGSYTANEDTFKKVQQNDGIYTLSVNVKDKAGNAQSETVVFTINRFGSIYVLGDYLASELNGKYVKSIDDDLVITEYNPSKLESDNDKLQLVLTRDGAPITLNEGKDYTVSPEPNENVALGESGWYQYNYVIKRSVFVNNEESSNQTSFINGVYKLYVSSEDEAGNKSESTSYEDSDVLFRLDTTAPTIKSVSGLEKLAVNATNLPVKYEIFDAIGLKSIDVYYINENGEETVDHIESKDSTNNNTGSYLEDLTDYNGSFTIGECQKAAVRIVAEDLAGNVTDTNNLDDNAAESLGFNKTITVSTNPFVRWYAHTVIFWVSIAVIIIAIAGLFFLIAVKKRKKDEQDTENYKKSKKNNKE